MLVHVDLTRLEEGLDHIRAAPADGGTVELIARRPDVDQREVLTEARLNTHEGLEGDTWLARGSSRTPDGGPNRDAQLTLMNARAAAAIAGERERWPLAGDQLYVDLDLSRANLPPGSRVQIGSAVIELSELPGRCGRHRATWRHHHEGAQLKRIRRKCSRVYTIRTFRHLLRPARLL